MSNLGMYQDFVIQTKSVGGVEKMIQQIEDGGVAKGVVGGIVGTLAVGGACLYLWRLWSASESRKSSAADAKDHLRAVVDDQDDSHADSADVDENPDGSGETR